MHCISKVYVYDRVQYTCIKGRKTAETINHVIVNSINQSINRRFVVDAGACSMLWGTDDGRAEEIGHLPR